ncbi:hypothetical protein BHE74_00029823 [Ensete ventricosum]|nr:hypothetical protein BHE74_00029823 [Ensete ventricosum]RZS04660.1 hypothetical protein BHM03_00035011 [Ensete ventricosum]
MQFNRGTSAMQHYVASRPMFIDVEVMNTDINLVLGDQGLQAGPSNIARGISTLYKEITAQSHMIDVLEIQYSLMSSSYLSWQMKYFYNLLEITLLTYFILSFSGLTESLFLPHKDEYPEYEQASLQQLYQSKVLFHMLAYCEQLQAEAAAAAGESSFRSFMIAVQRCASSVAILQQYFSNTISRLLPPDAHAASLEEMGTAVSSVEGAAQKGLQQCIETVMAEVSICTSCICLLQVERLLSAEQKTTDYRTPDDGNAPDHRPTNACIRCIF